MGLHTAGPSCQHCSEWIQREGHPVLQCAFETAKERFPDLHLAQVWRGEEDQNRDFLEHKSELKWPMSRHNTMLGEKPHARAFDCFQLGPNGAAVWMRSYYAEIAEYLAARLVPVTWGGSWKTLVDNPHFELHDAVPQNLV